MSKMIDVTTVVSSVDGLTTSAKFADGHELIFDQAKEAGGNNKGPSPGAGLLASIGACKMMSLRIVAEKMRLNLEDAHVEVTGTLDMEPEKGTPIVFKNIHADYVIKSDAAEKDIKRLVELAEFNCVVGNSVCNGTTSDYSIK